MAKSMKKGGPTSEDRAKYGKNMAKALNQTGKLAKGGSVSAAKPKEK
jgi:hypothetical protein